MDEFDAILRRPLVTLSGGTITLASILAGVLVLVAALALARLAGRATRSMMARRNVSPGAQFAASRIVRYVVVTLGTLVAIESTGLRLDAVLAASAVFLVGIGLGLQTVAQNILGGIILLLEQPIQKGDFIRVGDAYGVVEHIGLRATHVVTRDAVTILVPNGELVSSHVVNLSRPVERLRVWIRVGVAYGSDTARVREALVAVALEHGEVLRDPPPEVRLDAFGSSSLDFALLVWIADPRRDLGVASELRFAIDRAFRQAGIEIPFPQQVVHLRGGVAGEGDAKRGSRPA